MRKRKGNQRTSSFTELLQKGHLNEAVQPMNDNQQKHNNNNNNV